MTMSLLANRGGYVLWGIVLLLPFYVVGLSVIYQLTASYAIIKVLQSIKDVVIIIIPVLFLLYKMLTGELQIKLNTLDKAFLLFFLYTLLFLALPVGEGLAVKLAGFRSVAFFTAIYFCGRNIPLLTRDIRRVLYTLVALGILSGLVASIEFILYRSLQEFTGYATFNEVFYNLPPSGNYGLTWTYEIAEGTRRFASFFADPLEHSSSFLLIIPAIVLLYKKWQMSWRNLLLILAFVLSVLSLLTSVSRASTAVVLALLLLIALWERQYWLLQLAAFAVVIFLLIVLPQLDGMQDFILSTINFENPSSLGHLLEWIEAIETIRTHPLGIGLGSSGNIASQLDIEKTGGENQYLVVAVQIGIPGLLLYLFVLIQSIRYCFRAYELLPSQSYEAIAARLGGIAKIGILVVGITANIELYAFLSYTSWWLVGYSSQLMSRHYENRHRYA